MFSSRTSFRMRLSVAGAILLAAEALRAAAAEAPVRPSIKFDRDIHPILSENCFQCHGPDAKQRKAKLRLDVQKEALSHGAIIVPGSADNSELIERVSSDDPAV